MSYCGNCGFKMELKEFDKFTGEIIYECKTCGARYKYKMKKPDEV